MGEERRLRKNSQFARALKKGERRSGHLLVLRAHPNELGVSRLGILVSKRVGKAVIRNLVKRRLRSIASELSIKQGWDIVIIARPEAAEASYSNLKDGLARLLQSARLEIDLSPRPKETG